MAASSKDVIMGRIRSATMTVAAEPFRLAEAYSSFPRNYALEGRLSKSAKIALLVERLREYDADVMECRPDDLVALINDKLTESGRHDFAAPSGLPANWRVVGFEWKVDGGLSNEEIEKLDGVLTTASCAVADSGTIVLHHSPSEGRRVLTLLPDWHLCILFASQVVECLPEYFARFLEQPALVTWISGPSATADIEMTRIKGVHGPRCLHVILVIDE